jgi:CDK-activating kinase assembly factor MAT1
VVTFAGLRLDYATSFQHSTTIPYFVSLKGRQIMAQDDNADFEEDRAVLNKEARLRRHTLKVFNKRRDDFANDREHDDYLEMVEDIIFNLVNDVDVNETKSKVERYRRENQDLIGQNHARKVDEDRREMEILSQSERERMATLAALRKKDAEAELAARRKRHEEEQEELRRVSLGAKEIARLKKKQEKRERKEKRRAESERAAEVARAKAAEPDVRPMFFRPAFPNPPPHPIPEQAQLEQREPVNLPARAAGGGFLSQVAEDRALLEYTESVQYLSKYVKR